MSQVDSSNLVVVPNDEILFQQERVWYYGGFSEYNEIAFGHIVLTSQKILFFEQKPISLGQLVSDVAIETIGLIFTIPLKNIKSTTIEKRVRKLSSKPRWDDINVYQKIISGKKIINESARILNRKEQYDVLILSVINENDILSTLVFEVSNPMALIMKLKPKKLNSDNNILPLDNEKISTGIPELDNLLLGGLQTSYSILLTSPSCDEHDFLIQRFLKNILNNRGTAVYVCVDPSKILKIAEQNPSNFFILACNPRPDVLPEDLPNLHRVKGLENLSDINIGLIQLLENKINEDNQTINKVICLDLVSEVLLQHKLLNTRRWLIDIIPRLKNKNYTILATFNPHMYSSESTQTMLDVFDGHIDIFEKDGSSSKNIQVKKMFNMDYSTDAVPLDRKSIQN